MLAFSLALFICFTCCATVFAAGFSDISCEQAFAIYNRRNMWSTPDAVYQRIVNNGVSKSLSEMTKDDVLSFRDKIFSCNPKQHGFNFMSKQDFEVDMIWAAIQKARPVEDEYNKNKVVAESLIAKLDELEAQTVSQDVPYKEVASGFAAVMQAVHEQSRASVAFHDKHRETIVSRAQAGHGKVVQLWRNDLDQKVDQSMAAFNATVNDPKYTAAELFLQLNEVISGLHPELAAYLKTRGEDREFFLDRLYAPATELRERLQAQVLDEIQAAFAPAYERIKGASSPSDIAELRALRFSRSELEGRNTQYDALLSNPQTKRALQLVNPSHQFYSPIDSAIQEMSQGLENAISTAVSNICNDAAQKMCAEQVRDLDPAYKDHHLVLTGSMEEDGLMLRHLVCAAKNRGLYKKFSSGGLFSSAITLELESVTIYFREARVDLATLQEVGKSFKGPHVVNMLLATEFEPVNGKKQPVTKSGQEMQLFFAQLGGLPKPVECQ